MKQDKKAVVIGAGIVGLATARALALEGYNVIVIDRSEKAVGASVRNFGMVWPIGQPAGKLLDRAMRSREIWKEVAGKVGLSCHESGSIHLAHRADEWQVLQELYEEFSNEGREVKLMTPAMIGSKYPHVKQEGLLGGLYSASEMIVDPREALAVLPAYLEDFLGVKFIWKTQVNEVASGLVKIGNQAILADMIWVCNGADLETLYPDIFIKLPITRCKLQMMRFQPETANERIGTAICGGLSLIHYQSFKKAPSLEKMHDRYKQEMDMYLQHGIHVMVSQHRSGELTVGDSHEYGHSFYPFDKAYINELILDYLKKMVHCEKWSLHQSWHGIYAKMQNGQTEVCISPATGVYILNGLGGAGMTLSFGLAEEMVRRHC